MLAAKTLVFFVAAFSDGAEGLRRMPRKAGAHGSSGDTCGVKGRTNSSEASMLQTGDSIVGGGRVGECEWPWLVRLRVDTWGAAHSCSAVLISPKLVLSVKGCVSSGYDQHEAIAGNRNLQLSSQTEQRRKFSKSKMYLHSADKDFAIFELEEPFEMTDCVSPICIPSSGADLAPGTSCMMAGAGNSNDWNFDGTTIFWQQAEVTTVSADDCQNKNMTSERICAHGLGMGRRTADVGGPLFCEHEGRWSVFGVTTKEVRWEGDFAEKDFMTWLSVPQVSTWIAKVMAMTQ